MRLEISVGVWMSWFLGRRKSTTITTIARRQTRTPVRPVRESELVAVVDPGAEVTKVSITEQPRGHPSRSSHAGHHGVEVATLPVEPRICAQHM